MQKKKKDSPYLWLFIRKNYDFWNFLNRYFPERLVIIFFLPASWKINWTKNEKRVIKNKLNKFEERTVDKKFSGKSIERQSKTRVGKTKKKEKLFDAIP